LKHCPSPRRKPRRLDRRPTRLACPAHAERPDYLVIEDGETIGRIYDEGQYVPANIR
jgi:hypothetical protein